MLALHTYKSGNGYFQNCSRFSKICTMKVFVESIKVWFECGLRIDQTESNNSKLWSLMNLFFLLLSQGSYFLLSILYIIVYFNEIDIIQLLYIGLQVQMGFLALSSSFCLHIQRKNIVKMIQKVRTIVNKRKKGENNIIIDTKFVYSTLKQDPMIKHK